MKNPLKTSFKKSERKYSQDLTLKHKKLSSEKLYLLSKTDTTNIKQSYYGFLENNPEQLTEKWDTGLTVMVLNWRKHLAAETWIIEESIFPILSWLLLVNFSKNIISISHLKIKDNFSLKLDGKFHKKELQMLISQTNYINCILYYDTDPVLI